MAGETRLECDKHHLVYDPRTQRGCVLCRAESLPPRRKPLPSWVVPAVGGVLAIAVVVALFVAIAPSSSDAPDAEAASPSFNFHGRWAEEGRPGDGFQFRPDGQAVLTESSTGEFYYRYVVEAAGPPVLVKLEYERSSDSFRTPRFRSVRLRITPSGPDTCTIFLLSGDVAATGTRLGTFTREE